MFNLYWNSENGLIDYCLIDYFVNAFLILNRNFEIDLDKVPIREYRVFDMLQYMNQKIDINILKDLTRVDSYFRISYRNKMKKYVDGELTFYGYFNEKYNKGENDESG